MWTHWQNWRKGTRLTSGRRVASLIEMRRERALRSPGMIVNPRALPDPQPGAFYVLRTTKRAEEPFNASSASFLLCRPFCSS